MAETDQVGYRLPYLGEKPKEFDLSTDLGKWVKAAWDYREAYFELKDGPSNG